MIFIKRIFLSVCLLPLFCQAQKIPDFGFDKVRIAGSNSVIQAELLPVASAPKARADRFYFWYSSNTISSTQGGFSGNLLNGSYKEYYLNKNLKEQGAFEQGLKDGIWKKWNADGFLVELFTWKKGVKSGKFIICNQQGIITQQGYYKNDVLFRPDSTSIFQRINIFKKKN